MSESIHDLIELDECTDNLESVAVANETTNLFATAHLNIAIQDVILAKASIVSLMQDADNFAQATSEKSLTTKEEGNP